MYRTGRLPAVDDDRLPRMSAIAGGRLPAPPCFSNWYAAVSDWGMLGNDRAGCCVEAAILHAVQQMSTYAGNPLTPTENEALAFYAAATGWDGQPGSPSDMGSYVLGQAGAVPFWFSNGIQIGGQLNQVGKFARITRRDPVEWRQGIHLFGGMLVGINFPENLFNDDLPFTWRDASGPFGGHEIWINGYQKVGDEWLYDFVSWGQMWRMPESFLLQVIAEAVVIIDEAECNGRGVNGADFTVAELEVDMSRLR